MKLNPACGVRSFEVSKGNFLPSALRDSRALAGPQFGCTFIWRVNPGGETKLKFIKKLSSDPNASYF